METFSSHATAFYYKHKIQIYILTLNLLTTTIVAPPSNASKWQMGFNSAFKGLKNDTLITYWWLISANGYSSVNLAAT